MAKANKTSNQALTKEPVSTYINLLTDFGFKYIFLQDKFLLPFLNAIFAKLNFGITEIKYESEQRYKRGIDDRANNLDISCSTTDGKQIIIEMQYGSQTYFSDRILYYTSCAITDQNVVGEWNYKLNPVYSINIANFYHLDVDNDKNKRKAKKSDKYASYVKLLDIDNKQVFNNNLTIVLLELPRFVIDNISVEQSYSAIEYWVYALKEMHNLESKPDALKGDIFDDLFEAAKYAKLSKADRKKYNTSLKRFRSMTTLTNENKDLKNMNSSLSRENSSLSRKNSSLSRDIAAKDKRIADLEARLASLR